MLSGFSELVSLLEDMWLEEGMVSSCFLMFCKHFMLTMFLGLNSTFKQ